MFFLFVRCQADQTSNPASSLHSKAPTAQKAWPGGFVQDPASLHIVGSSNVREFFNCKKGNKEIINQTPGESQDALSMSSSTTTAASKTSRSDKAGKSSVPESEIDRLSINSSELSRNNSNRETFHRALEHFRRKENENRTGKLRLPGKNIFSKMKL